MIGGDADSADAVVVGVVGFFEGNRVDRNTRNNCETRRGVAEVVPYLRRLATEAFYGTVELRFEAGNVVHLIEHRSLKPDALTTPDNLRSKDDERAIPK